MPNTHQGTNGPSEVGRSAPWQRKTRRRASTSQQPKIAVAKAAEVEKITTLEIASYDGGRKTLSVVSRITMPTAIKIFALANQELKV
jgi:hypothetical protein